MILTYVPLLAEQRALYDLLPGPARFERYLRMMVTADGKDLGTPYVAMNPMGKSHVKTYHDVLINFDADDTAADVVAGWDDDLPGTYRVALVVLDDLGGGWTNRYACEHGMRFPDTAEPKRLADWIVVPLWTADTPPTADRVRLEVRAALHRHAYIQRHGIARTLREKIAQEGAVLSRSGFTGPALDAEELEYVRGVAEPLLDATDLATAVEVLFGDAAAATLGFQARGLGPNAGLAFAISERGTATAPSSI